MYLLISDEGEAFQVSPEDFNNIEPDDIAGYTIYDCTGEFIKNFHTGALVNIACGEDFENFEE